MDVNDLYQIKNGHTGKVVAEGLASNFAMLAKELDSNSTTAAIKSLKGYGKQDVPMGVSILTTDGDFVLPAEWSTLGVGKTADGIMVSDGTHFTVFNTTIGQNLAFGPINSDIGGIPNISDPAVARLDFDGKAHSAALTEANPAYAYCLGIGPDYYLPAAGQLYDAMQGSTEFNKALEALGLPLLAEGDTFWSSTEIDLDKAWAIGYPIGTTVSADKTIAYKVMAVKDYVAPQDALLSEDNTLNEALYILSGKTQDNTRKIENTKLDAIIHVPQGTTDWYRIGEISNHENTCFMITLTSPTESVVCVISNAGPTGMNITKVSGRSLNHFYNIRTSIDTANDKQYISLRTKVNTEVYIYCSIVLLAANPLDPTSVDPIINQGDIRLYSEAVVSGSEAGFPAVILTLNTPYIENSGGINATYFNNKNLYDDFVYKGRTREFIPALDYEPSTKKYVDDSIKNGVKFDGIVHLPAGQGYFKFADIDDGRNMNFLLNLSSPTNQVTLLVSLNTTRRNEILKLTGSSSNDLYEFAIYSANDNINRQLVIRKMLDPEEDIYVSCFILSSNPVDPNNVSSEIHPGTITLLDTAVIATVPDGWIEGKLYLRNNGVNANMFSGKTLQDFLYKGRTAEFVPATDYEPATKKYVDDQQTVLTQAEYDALGEAVNTDNKIYFITE